MLYFYKEEQGKIIDALFFPNATMADYERLKDAKDGIVFLSDDQKDYIPTEQPIIQLADGSYSFSSAEEAEKLQKTREFEQLRQQKMNFLKAERDRMEMEPITVQGYTFDFDNKAKDRIMAAIIALGMTGTSISWTLADGSNTSVNADCLRLVVASVAERSNRLHISYRKAKQKCLEAKTESDLNAIELE